MTIDMLVPYATTLGTIISAGSLAAGFFIYRLGKRDDSLAGFRRAVAASRSRLRKLDSILDHELAHEITLAVIESPSVSYALKRIHSQYLEQGLSPELSPAAIEEMFGVITAPARFDAVARFQTLLSELEADAAQYLYTFPAFSRLVIATHNLFRNVLNSTKRIARDEEIWGKIVHAVLEQEGTKLKDFEAFRIKMLLVGIAAGLKGLSNSQKSLNLMLEMMDLLSDVYLGSPNGDLSAKSGAEKAVKVKTFTETKTVTEDLEQVEKLLASHLSNSEQLHFRELRVKFSARFDDAKSDNDDE